MERLHRDVENCLVQFLAEHGFFTEYLTKMRKVSSSTFYEYYKILENNAIYIFFECGSWANRKKRRQVDVGHTELDDITVMMLETEEPSYTEEIYVWKLYCGKKTTTMTVNLTCRMEPQRYLAETIRKHGERSWEPMQFKFYQQKKVQIIIDQDVTPLRIIARRARVPGKYLAVR